MSDARRCAQALATCRRHARRLRWAAERLRSRLPFTAEGVEALSELELAVVDQLVARFAQLQDAMGARLFPAVLELTKEPGDARAFIDKLHQLERIGAIESAERWLELRAARNALVHDYPDDPEQQAAALNRIVELAQALLEALDGVERFARRYLDEEAEE